MPCETVGHVCQKGLWEACHRICTCIRWFGRGGGMNRTLLSTAAGEETEYFTFRGGECLLIFITQCVCFYLCSDLIMEWYCFCFVP